MRCAFILCLLLFTGCAKKTVDQGATSPADFVATTLGQAAGERSQRTGHAGKIARARFAAFAAAC